MQHRIIIAALIVVAACDDPAIHVETPCETCDVIVHVGDWDATGTGPEVWTPNTDKMCIPNNDGVITAAEMPVVVGAVVGQELNTPDQPAPVDPIGHQEGDGWVWDFRDPVPGDVHRWLKVLDPADSWYAEFFPGATNSAAISPLDPSILGVYRSGDGIVELLGLASMEEGPGRTLMVYDDPVVLYRFPLEPGKTWSQSVSFSDAELRGVKNAGTEDYLFAVDGRGTVHLPQMTLHNTLRVRMKLRQTFVVSQGTPTMERVYLFWVHECLGEVARMISGPGTTDANFTEAAEYRRISL